jgi:hypothetical protein
VERITANDEERRRQGYDLQTTFSFHGASSVTSRELEDGLGEILSAAFAPAALVRRINRGLRRRKDQSTIGFWIDPKSGYWVCVVAPALRPFWPLSGKNSTYSKFVRPAHADAVSPMMSSSEPLSPSERRRSGSRG